MVKKITVKQSSQEVINFSNTFGIFLQNDEVDFSHFQCLAFAFEIRKASNFHGSELAVRRLVVVFQLFARYRVTLDSQAIFPRFCLSVRYKGRAI
jgi:hypothetical protein